MRMPLAGLAFVLVAGCASQSQKAPLTAAAPATPAPKTVQQAQAAGYRIVNEDGKTIYCRDQLKTGSHVRHETICLTKEELEAAREASHRNMDQLTKPVPPPQGK